MNGKKITETQIENKARELGVEVAALKSIIEVECKGQGFNADGTPVILFERHVMYKQLKKYFRNATLSSMQAKRPDLCNPQRGGYGTYSSQNKRLSDASKFDRQVALESASWGLGQVMGYHWRSLGYATLQEFINAMYRDEYSQFDAMCRFLKVNNMVQIVRDKDWRKWEVRYNGAGAVGYAAKLQVAYKKFKKLEV